MYRWAKKMYFDAHVKKRRRRIMCSMKAGKFMPGIYCIALSSNPENLLDIIEVNQFRFPYYKEQEIYVLGLAFGKMNAYDLVTQMIADVYEDTGDVKVREYYKNRWDVC